MRRFLLSVALLALTVAGPAAGQASILGIRGLGVPGRGISPAAWGMGGATALLDDLSGLNPATIGGLSTMTATFVLAPQWRSAETPAGSSTLRDTQFPFFMVAGPVGGSPLSLGVSYSSYTSRTYRTVSTGTEDIRGTPVDVTDTLLSRGGLSDLRVAGVYRAHERLALGLGFHVITGENRMTQARVFSDTTYLPSRQESELSYAGWGVSAGAIYQPATGLGLGFLLRSDHRVSVERDSAGAYEADLPFTLGAGLQYRAGTRLMVAGQVLYRTWASANDDLRAVGGTGSDNTLEASAGLEFATNPRRTTQLPVRAGLRYAQLPFLVAGGQPSETGISIGTGFRFAAQRGGIDLALERVWRRAEGGISESAWQLVAGISVRPVLR